MKERPILFSDEMAQAILEGRKTQTRRLVKPAPVFSGNGKATWIQNLEAIAKENTPSVQTGDPNIDLCGASPYGIPGDQLWVRECWGVGQEYDDCSPTELPQWMKDLSDPSLDSGGPVCYRASGHHASGRWRPSIHIPRWASRIDLRITQIRVERLHSISEEDAASEGIDRVAQLGFLRASGWKDYHFGSAGYLNPRESFLSLWAAINGRESMAENPWVWVVNFEKV